MTRTDLEYRKTAAEGSSGIGLLIALFDTLAADLKRAAAAQRRQDIVERGHQVRHALLVIGYLESWMHEGTGGEFARQMTTFYASLRHNLLLAEANQSASSFEAQIMRVLELRKCWQELEQRPVSAPHELYEHSAHNLAAYSVDSQSNGAGNWSA